MPNSTPFHWHDLAIPCLVALIVLVVVAVIIEIAARVIMARDELRERYSGGRWEPTPIDFIGLPLWIALELICLVAALVFGLIMLFLAYEAAKSARDWWHAGDRGRRR